MAAFGMGTSVGSEGCQSRAWITGRTRLHEIERETLNTFASSADSDGML
jgi:hypothetical protein